MSKGEQVAMEVLSGLGVTFLIVVGVIIFGLVGLWLNERETIIECRCGRQFGYASYEEFSHYDNGVPIFKERKGSRDPFTRMKAAWHRKFTCEGEAHAEDTN